LLIGSGSGGSFEFRGTVEADVLGHFPPLGWFAGLLHILYPFLSLRQSEKYVKLSVDFMRLLF
jgi:hypothetical protein